MKIQDSLQVVASKQKAEISLRFFKTGVGQYGEGDVFIGITVPDQRKVAKEYYKTLNLNDIQELLNSEIHEHRLTGLMVLEMQFKKADPQKQTEIVDFYLKNLSRINNWDLVDGSAPYILGNYLLIKDRSIIYKLAASGILWQERIAILATFAFIKHGDFDDTLNLAEIFLSHKHDLMHKATGWMLREIGKKNRFILENFLKLHYKSMPRTMLRYAIERFEPEVRQNILKGLY